MTGARPELWQVALIVALIAAVVVIFAEQGARPPAYAKCPAGESARMNELGGWICE